ncbi:MAG: hypothetical protein C5B44_04585, partial [Acidobacteria bacterium]
MLLTAGRVAYKLSRFRSLTEYFMQLKLKRSQRTGGMMGGKVIFVLDARAEPSAEEASLVKKYNLG